ncbi:MAG: hypothetical protein WCP92_08590 [bacterium]
MLNATLPHEIIVMTDAATGNQNAKRSGKIPNPAESQNSFLFLLPKTAQP